MIKKKRFIFYLTLFVSISTIISLVVSLLLFNRNIIYPAIITVLFIVCLAIIYFNIDSFRYETNSKLLNQLDSSVRKAMDETNIGTIKYNNEYEIVWMSNFFEKRGMMHLDEKVLNWLPDLQVLLEGDSENKQIIIDDDKYLVSKIDQENILIFKEITNEYNLNKKLNDDAYVLGLIGYDNYDEIAMSEDDLAFINSEIKTEIINYFKGYNVVYKTLSNSKILLITNEVNFKKILDDRFSILTKVREVSKSGNVGFSISMAFARGSDNFELLDESAQSLLELAQTRGGDQVVVRKLGEDAKFFGGHSEAREKQSKTKVRVTVNSIKDLIVRSSNVIVVGHKDMDADCIGAGLCMSNFVKSLDKECYIIKSGGIEPMINDVLNTYSEDINSKHNLVKQEDVIDLIDDNTLVIMVDHHLKEQSNGDKVLDTASRVCIIDHHRRSADLDVKPLMVYIEPAASSACELTVEFLPYLFKEISISKQEANIMYLGLLIDTDKFRVRTTSRTFDVAKQLRTYGADPVECDELSQESYLDIIRRSAIINASKIHNGNIIISSLKDGEYDRTTISKAADTMVKSKGIDGAFVICNSSKDEVIVSARSNGNINVQVIMEKLNGGGHLMAAGLQRNETTVKEVEKELLKAIDEYLKEKINESNINS